MRLLADCTGKPIIIPRYIDAAVVFGSAILGAVAAEETVNEHISTKGRSRRSSILSSQKSQTSLNQQAHHAHPGEPHSPYTAPSATASTTNMNTLVYSHGNAGSHHQFPAMTPMQEEVDYFNQPSANPKSVISDEDTEDEEQTLSFGSKQPVQKGLSQKLNKLDLKPLSSIKKVTSKDSVTVNPGDKLWRVMEKMTGPGKVILPADSSDADRRLLNAKYAIFLEQCYKQQEYRKAVDLVEADNIKALKIN